MKNTFKKSKRPELREVKIGCSVMDNEGGSAYINVSKKPTVRKNKK